jgi:hypothetical protein
MAVMSPSRSSSLSISVSWATSSGGLQGVLRAVENGAWNDSLKTRLTELEGRKCDLETQLEAAAKPAPLVRLNRRAADIYRTKVGDLVASLNAEEIRLEAAEALRSLIDRVVLTPDPSAPDGLAVELHGALATILALASEPPTAATRHRTEPGGQNEKPPRTGVLGGQLSVVAGAGFGPAAIG